jgi:ketosteroid isomerase-like protein
MSKETKDFIKAAEAKEANVELVRTLIDAWNSRDPGLHAYHEDAEWDFTRSRFGEIRHSWKGAEGMRTVFTRVLDAWSELHVEAERIVGTGDEVVVIARHYGSRTTSGLQISDHGAYRIGLRDGKVAKFTFYPDAGEALQAAGVG